MSATPEALEFERIRKEEREECYYNLSFTGTGCANEDPNRDYGIELHRGIEPSDVIAFFITTSYKGKIEGRVASANEVFLLNMRASFPDKKDGQFQLMSKVREYRLDNAEEVAKVFSIIERIKPLADVHKQAVMAKFKGDKEVAELLATILDKKSAPGPTKI